MNGLQGWKTHNYTIIHNHPIASMNHVIALLMFLQIILYNVMKWKLRFYQQWNRIKFYHFY